MYHKYISWMKLNHQHRSICDPEFKHIFLFWQMNIKPRTQNALTSDHTFHLSWEITIRMSFHCLFTHVLFFVSIARKTFLSFQVCFDELRFGPLTDSLGGSMPHFEISRLYGRNQMLHINDQKIGIRPQIENKTKTILWMKVGITSSFFGKRATHCSYLWLFTSNEKESFDYKHLMLWSAEFQFCLPSGIMSFPYTEKSKNIFDASFQIYLWNTLFVLNYKLWGLHIHIKCKMYHCCIISSICTQSFHFSRYW